MRTSSLVSTLLLAIAHLIPLNAAETEPVQGVQAVIAALAQPAPEKTAVESGVVRPTADELAIFAARPDRTAAEWLALAKRWSPERNTGSEGHANAKQLLAALPPVAAWAEVRAGLMTMAAPPAEAASTTATSSPSRQRAAWGLLATVLGNERVAMAEALEAAKGIMEDGRDYHLRAAMDHLADQEEDPQRILSALQRRMIKPPKWGSLQITIPDIVALAGEQRALPVLRSALALKSGDLTVHGTQTRAVAQREALARIDTLGSAPWDLVRGPQAIALFEAFEKKFSVETSSSPSSQDYDRTRAEGVYLSHLIAEGRIDDAMRRLDVAKTNDQVLVWIDYETLAAQRPAELADALRQALDAKPQRPLWNIYAQLAAQLGRADELARMAHTHAAAAAAQGQLVDVLLAADQIEPALVAIRADIAAPVAVPSDDDQPWMSYGNQRQPAAAALRLLHIGLALERTDLIEEGCAALAKLPANAPAGYDSGPAQRTTALLQAGRPALAERLLLAELGAPQQQEWMRGNRDTTLINLVRLYQAIHRSADAVSVLLNSAGWQAKDLAELNEHSDSHAGIAPLAAIAGQALAAEGKTAEARRCALLAIDQQPGSDAGYALLLAVDRAGAPAVFIQQQQRDPQQDRALIWQAQAALDAGDVSAAERLAKAATDLDPSDGDQGPGDRMRSRSIWAQALEQLGRADEATLQRTALAAIRLGEHGDQLLKAGLTSRAVERYRASEKILDQAYCVQSRLAVSLANLGKIDEAAIRFRRSFELMPSSFGKRESHCFGCEGVFKGKTAQVIADEVFSGMVAKDATNPKHHYLLAYLRHEQDRHAEAADSLRRAIAIDPEYTSAVNLLLQLDDELRLPRAERQSLALLQVRLDPDKARSGWVLRQVGDVSALATALEALEQRQKPLAPHDVLPLSQALRPTHGQAFGSYVQYSSAESRPKSVGNLLADHPMLQVCAELLDR